MRRPRAVWVLLAVGVAGVCTTVALAYFGPTPGEVYRVWLDGRQIDLTASPADDTTPMVSPDGRRVAFVSDRGQPKVIPEGFVHLYVIGSDGRGLLRLSSALSTEFSFDGQIAWSPDSSRLVIVASRWDADGLRASLHLIGPDRRQRLIAHAPLIASPAWSPDGRLIVFRTGDWRHDQVWAVTATGRPVMQVPGAWFTWSTTGRLAVEVPTHTRTAVATVRVYDQRGQLQTSFPGQSFAWSPTGDRLASVMSDRLEVRSLSGRLLFRKPVPGLHRGQSNGLVWAGKNSVLIGGTGGSAAVTVIGVDIASGRISTGNNRYFGTLSPDRTLVADIAYTRRSVALTVSRPDGTGSRVLVRRSPCPDLVEGDVEWLPDGRSLVYDFKCQSTSTNP